MYPDLLYQIALTHVNGIGCVQSKILIEHFVTAEAIFKATKKELSCIEGIGEIKASQIKHFNDFAFAESEIKFIEQNSIEPLFLTNKDYPKKLLHCYDAPTLLYYKGAANLNATKTISIIGTRTNSDYGKQITEQIVADLAPLQVNIVSGLAFGIDAIAHKAALANNLATIGVLAHGLDNLYPSQHKILAKEMLQNGGLLTEFGKDTNPDKHNFPKRNRIVAGMADATIVIETANKGGSMITAELAYNYNRDLFAVPGKTTDAKSSGCLQLIHQNKASIYINTQQLIKDMGWADTIQNPKLQRELFIDLSPNEQLIFDVLQQKDLVHIDEINLKTSLTSSSVAAAILNLELQNIVGCLPGKMYKLI
jgi:DNA processing protein